MSGSVIAQILTILLIPIITRLYTPDDFGYFSIVLSIAAIIVIFSSLSYQQAIMLPRDDEDAANIASLCCLLIVLFSIATSVLLFFFSESIASALKSPEIAHYLWLVPLMVFFTSLFSVLVSWNARQKRFGIYAIANVSNSLSNRGIQVIFGLNSPSTLGLIAGQLSGYICAIVVLLKGFRGDIILFKQVTRRRMQELAVRYKRFPLFSSWSAIANSISLQIVPLILVYFYSPEIVGYYGVANQVVGLPMSVIGLAVAQVFFQKASEIKNTTGKIDQIVHGVHRRLISIGIFPVLLLLIIGDDLFAVVLGMEWYTAGIYAKILAPWLFLVFIAAPLQSIFNIFELQHIDLSFNVTLLVSRIGILLIGGTFLDPVGTLLLFSVTGIILWGWMNFYLLKLSNISLREGLNDYFHYLKIGIPVILPLLILKILMPELTYALIIIGILLGLSYYLLIIREDNMLKDNINRFIGR